MITDWIRHHKILFPIIKVKGLSKERNLLRPTVKMTTYINEAYCALTWAWPVNCPIRITWGISMMHKLIAQKSSIEPACTSVLTENNQQYLYFWNHLVLDCICTCESLFCTWLIISVKLWNKLSTPDLLKESFSYKTRSWPQ